MNIVRALGFGVMSWLFIFVTWFVLASLPFLAGNVMAQYIVFCVLLIPITILLARWYFQAEAPTVVAAAKLWVVAMGVLFLLDTIITVPLFIKSFTAFYTDWRLYVGFGLMLVVLLVAGGEMDNQSWGARFQDKKEN